MLFLTVLASTLLLASAKPNTKIVGGNYAVHGQFPYMALLRYGPDAWCGSSIISKNYVLTAAHCLVGENTSRLNIKTGFITKSEAGQVHEYDKFVVHPQYDHSTFQNDVALVKIKGEFEFNDNVQPVKLNDENVFKFKDAIVSGWGRLNTNLALSEHLKYAKVDIITTEACDNIFPYDVTTKVCAGTEEGVGFCAGDSGGPLVTDGKQIGIVNVFMNECSEFPNVYERVDLFLDWINAEIQK